MVKKTGPTNVQMQGLITLLKKTAIEQDAKIWKRIAEDLEKPSRQRRIVNLHKLEKNVKENEAVIVPGKVLGEGFLTKKIQVAAFSFSDSALAKLKTANVETLSISDLLKKNPKGQ